MKKRYAILLGILILTTILFLATTAYAIDVMKNVNGTYNVILPDGSGDQQAVTFRVKLITAKGSYVGNLYDSDGKCIATDRRFFFADAITDQLNDGEKGLVQGDEPEEKWDVKEIKTWLNSKQVKDDKGIVVVDDPYKYDEKDNKETLLGKITDVKELIGEGIK